MNVFFPALTALLLTAPLLAAPVPSNGEARFKEIDSLLDQTRVLLARIGAPAGALGNAPLSPEEEALRRDCLAEPSLKLMLRGRTAVPIYGMDALREGLRAYLKCEAFTQGKQSLCATMTRDWPLPPQNDFESTCLESYNYYAVTRLNITGQPNAAKTCETLTLSPGELDGTNQREECAFQTSRPDPDCRQAIAADPESPRAHGCVEQGAFNGDESVCPLVKAETSRRRCQDGAAYRKAYSAKDVRLCEDSLGCRMLMGERVCARHLAAIREPFCGLWSADKLAASLSSRLKAALDAFEPKSAPGYAARRRSADSLDAEIEKSFKKLSLPPEKARPAQTKEVPKSKAEIEWVRIPGGSFLMGSSGRRPGTENEGPVHRVAVKSFELAKTLVTNKQYRACIEAGACPVMSTNCGNSFKEDDQPVICVDWNEARIFSEWAGGRLPSEAEWEYAARSGGKKQEYPWGDEAPKPCEQLVMGSCAGVTTLPVCSKPKGNTSQGLCDMAGNAWEWVQDWYHDSYEGAPSDGSAWQSPPGAFRVSRGGSWGNSATHVRAAKREYVDPSSRNYIMGFRPARGLPD
jgi:formylglycine-generating enzyme required for sulfatase activity